MWRFAKDFMLMLPGLQQEYISEAVSWRKVELLILVGGRY
jgi:hypothetical protein